jgi:hypothetical protein
MAQAPDSTRAGRSFYVPEVRIAKLGQLRSGPEAGDILQDLRGDILRVEVTRVASGLSQYSITLNNWFPTGRAPREQKHLFPRFKYNHFDVLGFGQRLRIDMRYWPDPVQRLDAGAAKGWVPMIAGPITDMKFTFVAGEGARVEITGTDDLHALTNKAKKKEQFNGRGELEIVRALFDKAQYPLPIADAQVTRPKFMSGGRGISEAVEARQSYFDLVKKIAEKYDLEVFVEFASTSSEQAPALEFHFEPSRSRLPPDKTLRGIYVLEREKHLVDFTPTLKLGDQFTSASIKGRHRIRPRAQSIEAEAVGSILSDELHKDDKDPPLTSAPEVRKQMFAGEENPFHDDENPNLDEDRARVRAEAILRHKAREFLSISATTIGLPLLRPGRHIEIRGFRPPFDGFYYVEQTVHSFGEDGLRTKLTARRPGMPLPSTYQDL